MDTQLSGSDHSDHVESDDEQQHSLWPEEPNLSQVKPATAFNRFQFYRVTYTRDKDGSVKTVPIPPDRQRIIGMPSTYNAEDIASATIPRYIRVSDQDDDDSGEMNIHFDPPRPPSPGLQHDVSDSEASDSAEEPQNLIPSIASLQDSIPDPPWSRHDPSKYSLKTATWPEKGKERAHSPNSRQNHVSASSSRNPHEGEISPPGAHKRKASTDENYLSQFAAGSLRHLLPPAERPPEGNPKHRRKPYSNVDASPSRFSAMKIHDDDGDGSIDDYDSHEEPTTPPTTTFVPRPRIIKRAPAALTSDADEDAEFDPDEEDQLKTASLSSQVKNLKKKRKAGRFKCTEPWCKETFTRRNDVIRHLKNAAVHRSANGDQGASDKRCKFCNADLSRSDARARHERAGACGKRSMPRKDYKGKRILALEAQQAQAQG